MENAKKKNIIEAQICESFSRVVWSHKTQAKCADILNNGSNIIKILQIVLSAIITSGILISVFGNIYWVGVVSAIFSCVLLGMNMYMKNHDLSELDRRHTEAMNDLWNIREEYFGLLADIQANTLSPDEIVKKREYLRAELYKIYQRSPKTLNSGYRQACKALKRKGGSVLSIEEINQYLPEELRKKCMEK